MTKKESSMKTHPQRLVLRKIAARRMRSDRSDPRTTWVTFLLGSSSETAQAPPMTPFPGQRILTRRELEVLHLVATGETDRRIADRLFVSRRTVSSHVSNILAKLDVPSRRAAVITAARIGLLSTPTGKQHRPMNGAHGVRRVDVERLPQRGN